MTTKRHVVAHRQTYHNQASLEEVKAILIGIDFKLKAVERSNRAILAKSFRLNNRPQKTLIRKIVKRIIALHKKHARPVTVPELVDFFSGTLLGMTRNVRSSYITAHLSAEIKRPDTKIRRVGRGLYEPIADEELEGEKGENEDLMI